MNSLIKQILVTSYIFDCFIRKRMGLAVVSTTAKSRKLQWESLSIIIQQILRAMQLQKKILRSKCETQSTTQWGILKYHYVFQIHSKTYLAKASVPKADKLQDFCISNDPVQMINNAATLDHVVQNGFIWNIDAPIKNS